MASQALPKRSTRGLRMNKLLEDEDSADEEFWNQDAFAEEEDDAKYESESEEADVFDDDFNDDESSSDSEEVAVARERRKPALKAPERKAAPAQPRAPRAPRPAVKPDPSRGFAEAAFDGGDFGGKRTSKRSGVQAILKRSEEAREAARAKPAPRRPANAEPPRQLTQAEILAEAAATEIANLADLERLLSAEAATLKKAERAVKKDGFAPAVRARSYKDKKSGVCVVRVELRNGAPMPAPLNEPRPRTPETPRCVVSGAAAKYRDPATGLPFRDAAAFRELRRRRDAGVTEYDRGNDTKRQRRDADIGDEEPETGAGGVAASAEPGGFPGTPVEAPGASAGLPGMPVPAPKPTKRAKKSISLNAP
jgi:vacuolar protein sorting-associated protein 72